MAKKVKFPLSMGNDVMVSSIEDLKDNFNIEKVTEHFLSGKLLTWLSDRYYDEEADAVRELSQETDKSRISGKLCDIFGIENAGDVDVEAIEEHNEKLRKLREITSDDEIIANVDNVAFSHGDLCDLLDAGAEVIYLCGERFRIPLSVKNKKYIGINEPTVVIATNDEAVDLSEYGIVIEKCVFSEETKAKLAAASSAKTADTENSYTMRGIAEVFKKSLLLFAGTVAGVVTGYDQYVVDSCRGMEYNITKARYAQLEATYEELTEEERIAIIDAVHSRYPLVKDDVNGMSFDIIFHKANNNDYTDPEELKATLIQQYDSFEASDVFLDDAHTIIIPSDPKIIASGCVVDHNIPILNGDNMSIHIDRYGVQKFIDKYCKKAIMLNGITSKVPVSVLKASFIEGIPLKPTSVYIINIRKLFTENEVKGTSYDERSALLSLFDKEVSEWVINTRIFKFGSGGKEPKSVARDFREDLR